MIPYSRQDIHQDDIDAVVDVLKSDFLTQGSKVPEFESALCEYSGAKHTVAVNSATSALHLACLALGLGEGDWLWTSPITFVASANCGLYCGARVDFVDIDPDSFNMCPLALSDKLKKAERLGCLPKVVVVVHLAGRSCEMKQVKELSNTYGFKIIEDASHAIGASYDGTPVGAGRYSDITVFSFHPVKIVTSAEGGAALTNSEILARKMTLLRSHGVTRDHELMHGEPHGPWYYEQLGLGFNYRMSDIHAALGLSQLSRLEKFVTKRNELAHWYSEALKELPLDTPEIPQASTSAWHLYVVRLKLELLDKTQRQVFESLRRGGVGVNLHYMPVYKQPYYQQHVSPTGLACPHAEVYYKTAISLPIYPALIEEQMMEVIRVLKLSLARV